MQILYKSTRGNGDKITASQAILKGLSDDGGLFVPDSIPKLDVDLEALSKMTYQEIAYEVMSRFFTDFTEEELKGCIKKAYDSKFEADDIVPVTTVDFQRMVLRHAAQRQVQHDLVQLWEPGVEPHAVRERHRTYLHAVIEPPVQGTLVLLHLAPHDAYGRATDYQHGVRARYGEVYEALDH